MFWQCQSVIKFRVTKVRKERFELTGIYIVGQNLEKDKISVGATSHQSPDLVKWNIVRVFLKRQLTKVGSYEEGELVEKRDNGHDDHEEIPDPDYEIDLLVENVNG